MSKLITGGTGFLGAQLALMLVNRGEDVILFDMNPNWDRIRSIKDKVKVILGNLADWPVVMNVVKENRVEGIYHLGAMLTVPSQAYPWASFQTNVCGTMNLLEAARLFNVKELVFVSSIATYALGIPLVITDDSLQRPTSMYGCCKLYCELVGRFYRSKFGLDFRTFRSPTLVGPGVITPGVTQYVSQMIEHAALGKHFECYVSEETKSMGFMYFKDAIRGLDLLYQAPMGKISTVNYNVSGLKGCIKVKELEEAIRKHVGRFSISYKPDKEIVEYLRKYETAMHTIDDTRAREEWGWKPLYQDLDIVIEDFINEVHKRPEASGVRRL